MRITAALLTGFAAMLACSSAQAFRCGNDLVLVGDSVLAVEDACGHPDRKVVLVGKDDQRVGTAFYYRLEQKAPRKVYMRGGTVTRVERLD